MAKKFLDINDYKKYVAEKAKKKPTTKAKEK